MAKCISLSFVLVFVSFVPFSSPVLAGEVLKYLTHDSVAFVARTVGPCLVNITVSEKSEPAGKVTGRLWQPWSPGKKAVESEGSGVIYDSRGFIVTNYHVISGAKSVEVSLYNGVRYRGFVKGRDIRTDLAVIYIDDPWFSGNLPENMVAHWGNSDDLETGQFVVASGSPYSLRQSVTLGIISALGRSIPSGDSKLYNNLIQTDASINPGNSGGPLADLWGKIIGVNSALRVTGQGLGFAIPSNLVRKVADDIIATGHVRRASLGISLVSMTLKKSRELNLKNPAGVIVESIEKNGAAFMAGMKKGDVILTIDGKTISEPSFFIGQVQETPIGESVKLSVWRNQKSFVTSVPMIEHP